MQSLVEINPVILEKKILKAHQSILVISKLSLFGKKTVGLQIEISFNQGCFVLKLIEIDPVILEKKMNMWKVYREKDRQTNNGRHAISKAHLSFQLR